MRNVGKIVPKTFVITFFTLVVVAGLALSAHRVIQVQQDLLRQTAIEDAANYAETLIAFRAVYTSEVVTVTTQAGLPTTHDYMNRPGTIPLPATLTKLLGEKIGESGSVKVGLYSEYPFPWRTDSSSLDRFQREAIKTLIADPTEEVIAVEQGPAGPVVRYAIADRMDAQCVSCHNTHPDSPKRDWVTGDVRGVLEVTHPIGPSASSNGLQSDLEGTIKVLTGAGIAAMAILLLIAIRHRRIATQSQRMAKEAEAARIRIQEEMVARIEAEEGRIAAEALAQHKQKMESLGMMASGLAHDVNNLLVSIVGNIQLAQIDSVEGQDLRRHMSLVEQAGIKAADLTQKLLEYAGDSPSAAQPQDINLTLEELTPLMMAAISGRAMLTLELEQGLPDVLVDKTQIEQVLLNLVTNAAEASDKPDPYIIVRTGLSDLEEGLEAHTIEDLSASQTHVFIEVEDSGCGIDEQTRSRIFDPFFTTKNTGRGLGLSTILGIIKTHEGSLLVRSQPGEGACFRVGLPTAPLADLDT